MLTAMKEGIEHLTKRYQSVGTELDYHISFGRNRDEVACKRKIGRLPTKRSLRFLRKESSKSKNDEVRSSSCFGASYQESSECI